MENEEDTSYFDSRLERYSHHEFDDSDTDDSPVLSSSFASYSPQYRKHCYNNNNRNNNYGSDESNSSLNDSGKLALDIRNLNVSLFLHALFDIHAYYARSIRNFVLCAHYTAKHA